MNELDQMLTQLETAQLLRRLNDPDVAYMFKHVLTQEAAYQSLLMRRRRTLHRLVAESYEKSFAERLDEYASLLAQHYAEAGDDAKTLRYHTLAGDAAAKVYAHAEAIEHYTRALDVTRRFPASNEQLIHLYTRRGRVFEVNGQYDDALANYAELAQLAAERHDPALEIAALIPQATIYGTPTAKYDLNMGRTLSERTLELARARHDARAEAKALWNLMLMDNYSGAQPEHAAAYGEASLAIARAHHLKEETAYALHDLTRPYLAVKGMDAAKAALKEAIALWRELGNLPMLADGLVSYAAGLHILGQFDEAWAHIEEALEITRAIGNLWGEAYAVMNGGPLLLQQGEVGRAIQMMEDILRRGDKVEFIGPTLSIQAELVFIYATLGMVDRSEELLRVLSGSITTSFNMATIHPLMASLEALVVLLRGDTAKARDIIIKVFGESLAQDDHLRLYIMDWPYLTLLGLRVGVGVGEHSLTLTTSERALHVMHQSGVHLFRAEMTAYQAQALWAMGRSDEALQTVQDAWAEAEAIGSRRALWEVLPIVYSMAMAHGQADLAARARQQARAVIQFTADHIHQPDVRAAFLAHPQTTTMLAD